MFFLNVSSVIVSAFQTPLMFSAEGGKHHWCLQKMPPSLPEASDQWRRSVLAVSTHRQLASSVDALQHQGQRCHFRQVTRRLPPEALDEI